MDMEQFYYDNLKKKVQGKVYKSCFVPGCQSSTLKTRQKLFVSVPTNIALRRRWAAMARRVDAKTLKSTSQWYCCEDHFEVRYECSTIRHIECSTYSSSISLSPNIRPHLLVYTFAHCANVRLTLLHIHKNSLIDNLQIFVWRSLSSNICPKIFVVADDV